jgi:hypothetical protein
MQSGIMLFYRLVDQGIVVQIPAGAPDVSLLEGLGGPCSLPSYPMGIEKCYTASHPRKSCLNIFLSSFFYRNID